MGTSENLRGELLLTAGGNLLLVLSFGQFLLFPLYVQQLGGTPIDIGVLVGSAFVSSIASRLFVGSLLDRVGRIKIWRMGGMILSIAPLLLLIPSDLSPLNYGWILFVRACQGMGTAINFSAGFTYAADLAPVERRTEIIGLFGISGLLGMALGPLVGEVLLKISGFGLMFMGASVLAAFGTLVIGYLRERLPGEAAPPMGLRAVLGNRPTLIAVVTTLFFTCTIAVHGSLIAPFTRAVGLELASPFFLAYSFGAVATRVFWAKIPDVVGKNSCISPALFASAIGIMSLSMAANYPTLVLAGGVAGIGHGFLYPSLNALAVDGLPPKGRGMATSIFTGSFDGGTGLATILLSLLLDRTSYTSVFMITGAVVLTGMLYHRMAARPFLVREREERKRRNG